MSKSKEYRMKVKSAIKKRFTRTGSGKIKAIAAFNRHGMLKASSRRTRNKYRILSGAEMKMMSKFIIK